VGEQSETLKRRLKQFALDVMALAETLPRDEAQRYLVSQLIRSSNATAANYRAACRGRSKREFVARIGVAAEEADESAHWLDMLTARSQGGVAELRKLLIEAHELEAILSASYGTSKRRLALQKVGST